MSKRRRPNVDRTERVKPTPEAAQHHRPWPLMLLLHQGAADGGLEADEFEACIEIVETFKALVADCMIRPSHLERISLAQAFGGMSDRAAVMTNVWFTWSKEIGPAATHIVEQIEDSVPIRSPELLRLAARRWLKIRRDMLRSLDSEAQRMRLTAPVTSSYGETHNGDRGYALPISPPPTPTSQRPSAVRAPTQGAHRSVTPKRT